MLYSISCEKWIQSWRIVGIPTREEKSSAPSKSTSGPESPHLKFTMSSGLDENNHQAQHTRESLAAPQAFDFLLLWVHADKSVLYPRLDARVGKMLDRGLLLEVDELTRFRATQESITGSAIDQSRGIWVSIGYKEFLDYQSSLSQGTTDASNLEKQKSAAIEKTQAATRQYASRQTRWIRIKLLNALFGADQKSTTFLLDGSDLSQWEERVTNSASTIVGQYLSGEHLPEPSSLSEAAAEMLTPKQSYDLGQRPDLWKKKVCETCGTVAITENDWKLHGKSRAHRRAVGIKKKQANKANATSKDCSAAQAEVVDVLETYLGNLSDENA